MGIGGYERQDRENIILRSTRVACNKPQIWETRCNNGTASTWYWGNGIPSPGSSLHGKAPLSVCYSVIILVHHSSKQADFKNARQEMQLRYSKEKAPFTPDGEAPPARDDASPDHLLPTSMSRPRLGFRIRSATTRARDANFTLDFQTNQIVLNFALKSNRLLCFSIS